MVGEVLYFFTSKLIGDVGVNILALFLFIAGILLLTGASVVGVINKTRGSMAKTTAHMRSVTARVQPRKATAAVGKQRDIGAGSFQIGDPDDVFTRAEPAMAAPNDTAATSVFSGGIIDLTGGAGIEEDATVADQQTGELADDPFASDLTRETKIDGEDEFGDQQELPVQASDASDNRFQVGPDDLTPQGRLRASVTEAPDFPWRLPEPNFLKRSGAEANRPDTGDQERVSTQLIETLGHFGIKAKMVGMVSGPHITRYEIRLAPGTKVGKVAQLKDDLAYGLAASDIRILAPIPGKQAVGVEVPNASRRMVHLGDVLAAGGSQSDGSPLTVMLGKDVSGRGITADLAKMPHLLVAGTTGAGKSGCVNAMLASILLRATPHDVRMVLVDPKQVELNHYESIPHLLTPVITSPRQAAIALQNLVREMEQRYSQMSLARTRGLVELNKVREGRGEPPLPYILCVIDELADLMMVAPADVEDSIIRLAQKARAVGIHLVLATQSPRVDVITGMIKANVPSRIAFSVSSQTDSRVILDQNGAEALLGQGDMLFAPVGSSRLQRIQGAYIDEGQIAHLTEAWRKQGEPEFHGELLEEVESEEESQGNGNDGFDPDEDPLLHDAIRLVAEMQTASTSMLQRRLRLGYTRAGRLIDMLERRNVISGYEGSKPRQVLITEADVPRVLAALSGREAGGEGGSVEEEITDRSDLSEQATPEFQTSSSNQSTAAIP
jgi:S-DNA-T family DNA segregation ATPase FtsK/SpoIIIE